MSLPERSAGVSSDKTDVGFSDPDPASFDWEMELRTLSTEPMNAAWRTIEGSNTLLLIIATELAIIVNFLDKLALPSWLVRKK